MYVAQSHENIAARVREWRGDALARAQDTSASAHTSLVRQVGWFSPASPCEFIRLPPLFQDIVIQITDEKCTRCQNVCVVNLKGKGNEQLI